MKILPESRGGSFCLLLIVVLCSVAQSLGREVEVVGYAESSTIKNPQAFSGLRVTIECKTTETKDHLIITRGSGEVDKTGKFTLKIQHDIVSDDGTLKEACYAQLHTASGDPCPANDGLEASKIVFLSKSGEKHVLGLKQNLKFSPELCSSKFFWLMHKFPKYKFTLPPSLTLPPFPKIKKKPCTLPKIKFPPLVPVYKPPVVIIKKPCPPKISKPPVKILPKKPCPPKAQVPHVPIPKPHVPIHKPIHKPKVPIHKPINKPKVPIYKPIHKPPVPFFKPPFVIPKKPCPPKIPLPVVVIPKKAPCPPLPKLPIILPKFKIPHPKFGKWPGLPSKP